MPAPSEFTAADARAKQIENMLLAQEHGDDPDAFSRYHSLANQFGAIAAELAAEEAAAAAAEDDVFDEDV